MFNGDTLRKLESAGDLIFELQTFITGFEEDRWEVILNDAIEEINDEPGPFSKRTFMNLAALIQGARKSDGLKDRVIPAGPPIELGDDHGKMTIDNPEVDLTEDNTTIRRLLDLMESKIREKLV